MHMWLLLLLSVVSTVIGQNCSVDDALCSSCAKIGNNTYTKSLYTSPFCSVLYEVGDRNTPSNIIDRCKQAFNSTYHVIVECQLPIFMDANLNGKYVEVGLRSPSWSYFIGISRGDNCSSDWYYKAANGFLNWARNSTSLCDLTQMAFEGMVDKEVNPGSYSTNSFVCQCALKVEDLPGTSSGNINFSYLFLIFASFIRF